MQLKKNSAFTMMETMLVLFVIGVLAAILIPRIQKGFMGAKSKITNLKIGKIKEALTMYNMDSGHFPTKREGGLQALLRRPAVKGAEKWNGPYLDSENDLKDGWDYDFVYNAPPAKYKNKYKYFEIISFGADGQEGGTGDNAEIADGV